MKKKFFTRFFGVAMLLSFAACAEQEDIIPVDRTKGVDVSFVLDIQDFSTRLEASDACMDMDALEALADADNLWVRFSIESSIYTSNDAESSSYTDENGNGILEKTFERKIKFTTEGIVAEPVAISADPQYPSTLTSFIVYDATDPEEESSLYSAIGENSPMFSKLIGEDEDLPMDISIPEGEKYQKTLCDIVVACATESEPTDFGFKMWDIKFIKRFNIPYVVNNCYIDGLHFVASGKIDVFKAKKDADGNLIQSSKELLYTSNFGNGTSDLWIYDDYSINDENEWLYMELTPDAKDNANNEMREGWINVAEAIDIESNPNYISEFDVLDINLCSNNPTFIGAKEMGTYWIEDLWGQGKSDLDFNDLIVEYTYLKYYTYAENEQGEKERMLHKMDMNFKFVAMGAGNLNAFAMRFNNVDGNDIKGDQPRTLWRKGPNETEYTYIKNYSERHWEVTDGQLYKTNKNVLAIPIEGDLYTCFDDREYKDRLINTYSARTYYPGTELKVITTFDKYIPGDVEVSPMLLYKTEDKSNQYYGHEINMPNIAPSSQASYDFYRLNNSDDGGKYIMKIGEEGNYRYLPWIIDIPAQNVAYAAEGNAIDQVFNIGDWGQDKDFSFDKDIDRWYEKTAKNSSMKYTKYPVAP